MQHCWLICFSRLTPFVAATIIILIVFIGSLLSWKFDNTMCFAGSLMELACCVLAAISSPNNYSALLFSWHPILMTLAFVCCMPYALTMYVYFVECVFWGRFFAFLFLSEIYVCWHSCTHACISFSELSARDLEVVPSSQWIRVREFLTR